VIIGEEERLFVISDLHLGNPSSTARSRLVEFLDTRITGTSICINGDGFEVLQTSFRGSIGAVPVLSALRRLMRDGCRLLPRRQPRHLARALPRGLAVPQIAPFLNLRSGDSLIRIEHGHLTTRGSCNPAPMRWCLAGAALLVHPDIYSACEGPGAGGAHKGDPPCEVAAGMLLSRLRHGDLRSHAQPLRRRGCRGPLRELGNWLRGGSTSRSTTARSS
jgi:hypothetical protein